MEIYAPRCGVSKLYRNLFAHSVAPFIFPSASITLSIPIPTSIIFDFRVSCRDKKACWQNLVHTISTIYIADEVGKVALSLWSLMICWAGSEKGGSGRGHLINDRRYWALLNLSTDRSHPDLWWCADAPQPTVGVAVFNHSLAVDFEVSELQTD